MIVQEIEPDNMFCLIMKSTELEDLIKCVSWFQATEADLQLGKKWQLLLEKLKNIFSSKDFLFSLIFPYIERFRFIMHNGDENGLIAVIWICVPSKQE